MAYPIIDTHAHAYDRRFADEASEMKARAMEAGLIAVCLPNVDEESLEPLLSLHQSDPSFFPAMLGLHPCSVGTNPKEQLERLWSIARDKASWVAVGEIGLDLYWDKSKLKNQQEALAWQIAQAKQMNLPICLHTREAHRETVDLIQAEERPERGGVFHCFTGTLEEAKQVLDLGFYLGIGGVLTFKNSQLKEVLRHIGVEHLVLETDSPYLAPVPHRGKRNEPAYTALVFEFLAEALGVSMEKLAETTTQNARSLFNLQLTGQDGN
jgi:TatD DNase family protein